MHVKCPMSPLTNTSRTCLQRDGGPAAYTRCYSGTASDITTGITSTIQAPNLSNTLSRLLNGECHAVAKRTPSGASCLEPRLKLQVSLVQGRLAALLPSPVRPFAIQHAKPHKDQGDRLLTEPTLPRNTISHSILRAST